LAGFGTKTGELGDSYSDRVVTLRLGVIESFDLFAGLAGHFAGKYSFKSSNPADYTELVCSAEEKAQSDV
jgi:hypothetical protein